MVVEAVSGGPDSQTRASWLDLIGLLLVAILLLWGIGSYGLYEPHEAQYGGGASEMVQRGDWVTSYINGDRELNKPPLFYWLIATSFLTLSHFALKAEFVARLPLVLIALSGIALAWQWARELWGLRAGRFAALMLAVSSGWYVFAHQLMIDELLAVLVLASAYCLWKAITAPVDSLGKWAPYYVMIGLATLAKGLLGLFFPLGILALFILIRRDWALIRRCKPLLGILIIAAVVGPWAVIYESHNPGALRYIVVNEHFKRIFDQREPHDYGGVQVSTILFIMFTLIWCSPWSFVLPQVLAFGWGSSKIRAAASVRSTQSDAVLLLCLGAALPVALFSAIPSRLIYYAMPAVPPFVILSGGFWSATECWNGWKRRLAEGVIAAAGLVSLSATFWLVPVLADIPDLEISPGLMQAIPIELLIIGASLLFCATLLHLKRERGALGVLVLIMAGLEIFNVGQFANFDRIASSKRMVEALAPALGAGCIWISEGSEEVGASAGTAFYLRLNTPNKSAQVLIMGDDPVRPPPTYPGPPLNFFIDHAKLEQIWTAGKPAVFVTDFKLRRVDRENDKPKLPSTDCREVPLTVAGHRQVYANSQAWKLLQSASMVK